MHATCKKSKTKGRSRGNPTNESSSACLRRHLLIIQCVTHSCDAGRRCRNRGAPAEFSPTFGMAGRWARVEPPYGVNQQPNYTAIAQSTDSGGSRPPRRSHFGSGCGGSRYRTEIEVTHPLYVFAHRRFRTIRIARRNRVRYRLMVLLQRARFKSDRVRKSTVD
jgi:hypothetical protein